MNQLSEKQQRQLNQIRDTLTTMTRMDKSETSVATGYINIYVNHVTLLLSLLDSDSQAAEGIPDDLPYRIVEAMDLGLTFRSCSCGQLPCARLRPLRDALETVRRDTTTAMRDKCVDAIKSLRATPHGAAYNNAINDAIRKVESLNFDQVKPGEM